MAVTASSLSLYISDTCRLLPSGPTAQLYSIHQTSNMSHVDRQICFARRLHETHSLQE